MYKVIKESYWIDSKRNLRNFYSYVRANSIMEATKYAAILGYNYNSSEWFEQSYKVLNKDYKITKKSNPKKEDNFFKKIIKKIK